jgi:hypothetical protein
VVGSLVISLISVQLQNYSFKNLPSKRATTFDQILSKCDWNVPCMILFQVCSINEASNQMHVFSWGRPLSPIIIQCVMHGAFSAHILDITCKYKYISSGILVQNAYRYKKKTYYY